MCNNGFNKLPLGICMGFLVMLFSSNCFSFELGFSLSGDFHRITPGCEINFKMNKFSFGFGQTSFFGYFDNTVLNSHVPSLDLYKSLKSWSPDLKQRVGMWLGPLTNDSLAYDNYYVLIGYDVINWLTLSTGVVYQRQYAWQSFDWGLKGDSSIYFENQYASIGNRFTVPIGVNIHYPNFPISLGMLYIEPESLILTIQYLFKFGRLEQSQIAK